MTVRIRGNTRIKSQTLVGFPPQPALNLNFTQGYANGLNPLPSTVTFTRADSAAVATQVGPDGLLRLAAHNINPQSNNFSNAFWANNSAAVSTTETASPDGGLNAFKYTTSGSTTLYPSAAYLTVNANTTYTASCYFKAGTAGYAFLVFANFSDRAGVFVNLATGAYSLIKSSPCALLNINIGVSSAGNGWFRAQISATTVSTSISANIMITDKASPTYTNPQLDINNSTAGVYGYIYGVQLEQNLTPSYYVPTTTAAKYADTPRFDYSPVTTEPLGLLIEESRQNVARQSSSPSSSEWTVFGAAKSVSSVLAPDGQSYFGRLTANNTTAEIYNQTQFTSVNGVVYTASAYVRAGTCQAAVICMQLGASSGLSAVFDITGSSDVSAVQTFTGTGCTLVASRGVYVGNGVYRIWVSGSISTAAAGYIIVGLGRTSGNTFNTIGEPTNSIVGQTLDVWGWQVETGSFPTSYIPTTSGPVTREKEEAKTTNTSWNSATAGTYLVATNGTPTTFGQFIAPNLSQCYIGRNSTSTTQIYTQPTGGAVIPATIGSGGLTTSPFVAATAYDASNVYVCANGGTVATSATAPNAVGSNLWIGSRTDGLQVNAAIKSVQYWPARFSNAQLQLITKG